MSGWAWTFITLLFALNVVQVWYFTDRVWFLNQQHQRHVEDLRFEYRAQDQMLKNLTLPQMIGEIDHE